MELVWLDFETTGLDPDACAVIEAGVIVTTARLEPLSHHHFIIEPPAWCVARMDARSDDYVRTRVGYSEERWRELQARPFAEHAPALVELLKGRRLAGHCTHFERDFLKVELKRCDLHLHGLLGTHRLLSLESLADPLLVRGAIEDCALWRICEALDVEFEQERAHSAPYDIRATLECARALRELHRVPRNIIHVDVGCAVRRALETLRSDTEGAIAGILEEVVTTHPGTREVIREALIEALEERVLLTLYVDKGGDDGREEDEDAE